MKAKRNELKMPTRRRGKEVPAPQMQRPSGVPACAGGTCSCALAPTSLDHSHKAPAVRGSQATRKQVPLKAPLIPSSVLSTTNLLIWLASNFPDGLMVAELGIGSHKTCVHFVDSSRIGSRGLEAVAWDPQFATQILPTSQEHVAQTAPTFWSTFTSCSDFVTARHLLFSRPR